MAISLKTLSDGALMKSGGTMTGDLNGNGSNVISGFSKIYNAVWNDYAEYFEKGEDTEPGDIIGYDSIRRKYVKATSTSSVVVGCHSDSYGIIVGGSNSSEYNNTNYIPVGLAGRVKCKVVGKISVGDRVSISDLPGIGIKSTKKSDHIVGVALESKSSYDISVIRIQILLVPGDNYED